MAKFTVPLQSITGNLITSLPDCLFNLPKLTKINVSNNPLDAHSQARLLQWRLTKAPVFSIESLSTSTSHDSDTQQPPAWMNELWVWAKQHAIAELNWLEIDEYKEGGEWYGLPKTPHELKQLRTLKLNRNSGGTNFYISHDEQNLGRLPSQVYQLTNLQQLNLQGCGLTEISHEIGNLVNLEVLNLSHNKLKTLPAEIGKLKNLKQLILTGNHLEHLPPEVWELTQLSVLWLEGNNITHIPTHIKNLTKLTNLHIGMIEIDDLIEDIGQVSDGLIIQSDF